MTVDIRKPKPKPKPASGPEAPPNMAEAWAEQDARRQAHDPSDVAEAELVPRRLAVAVNYRAPDGSTINETVHSEIRTHSARLRAAGYAAQLAGGMPWVSLPPADAGRYQALALVETSFSGLSERLRGFVYEDDSLLFALAAVAGGHEHRYFRGDDGEGGAAPTGQRVRVAPVGAPPDPSGRARSDAS